MLAVARPGVAAFGVGPVGGEHGEPAGVAVALAELSIARRLQNERQVGKHGIIPSKRPVQQDVQWRARQPFFAPDYVRDAHVVVVHHVGEVVSGQAVGLHQNLVVQHTRFEAHAATDGVFKLHLLLLVGGFEPHHKRRAAGLQLGHLLGPHREAVAQLSAGRCIVLEDIGLGGFAQRVQFFRRVKRFVSESLIQQHLHRLAVQFTALTLAVGTAVAACVHALVRRESAPCQGFFDVGFRPFDKAALVGVFDSQNEGPSVGAGEQPVVQRSPNPSHVEWPGGAGCKAYSNVNHGPQR